MIDLLRDRNTVLALACCLIFGCVLGLTLLLVPLYTLALSDSPLILALVVSTFPLTGVLLSLASGLLCDYFGRRMVIIGGFVCLVCACLVCAAADSYYWLLIGQILAGLGDVTIYVAAWSFLIELAPSGKQVALQGLGSAAAVIGEILGPLVGGYVAEFAGFPTAFLVGGGLAVLGLVVATGIGRTLHRHDGDSLLASLIEYHRGAWRLLTQNSAVLWANLVHGVGLITWQTMGGSFYLAYLTAAGFSSSGAGALIAGHMLVAMLGQLSLGYFSGRASTLTLALGATAIGALTVGITPLLASIPVIALVGCLGGVSRVWLPVLIGFVADNTDHTQRSMGVALFNLSWAITSPIALFTVAVLVERVSLSSSFFLIGAFVAFSSLLLWVWAKRHLA